MPPSPQSGIKNARGEALAVVLDEGSPGTDDVVVVCHGFRSSKEGATPSLIARGLAARGVAAARFDFSGNGESEGEFEYGNYKSEAEDLRAVVEGLRARGRRVAAIVGHSKGGNCVVLYAAKYGDVPLVVNVAGRFDTREGIVPRFGSELIERVRAEGRAVVADPRGGDWVMTRESYEERLATDMAGACASIPSGVRLLTVHGTDDRVVPVLDAHSFERAVGASHTTVLLPGASHLFVDDEAHAARLVREVADFVTLDEAAFAARAGQRAHAPEIVAVTARQVFDSRGNPTVEAEVETRSGRFTASVPSGASTGVHEAHEMRDGPGAGYMGKGVAGAVRSVVDEIGPALAGMDPRGQRAVDARMCELDGTPNKSRLGANAVLAVSMAVCRAGAAEDGVPLHRHVARLAGNRGRPALPVPAFNIINGGEHAGNGLAFQEFMVLPVGASSFSEAMRMGSEVFHTLRGLLAEEYGPDAVNVGDEGGFAPPIVDHSDGLRLVDAAIAKAGYTGRVKIGVDVAASEFQTEDKKYDLLFKVKGNDGSGKKTPEEMVELYKKMCEEYPIVSIEDPFEQDDWAPTKALTETGLCQVVGDDILVTNAERVGRAIEFGACNALLLKVNQIGTISEAVDAVGAAKRAGWAVMASHRSGETEDPFIADLAVGLSTGQIKTGAPCRSERLAKYNQLLRIEEELGDEAYYAGEACYRHIGWED